MTAHFVPSKSNKIYQHIAHEGSELKCTTQSIQKLTLNKDHMWTCVDCKIARPLQDVTVLDQETVPHPNLNGEGLGSGFCYLWTGSGLPFS